jgi:hypothetical protein
MRYPETKISAPDAALITDGSAENITGESETYVKRGATAEVNVAKLAYSFGTDGGRAVCVTLIRTLNI